MSLSTEGHACSCKTPPQRTWAGTTLRATERANHYLHLMAFHCMNCNGPAVGGWICKREDDIAKETEATGIRAICLFCGSRPEAPIDPLLARQFRPVEWQWLVEDKPATVEPFVDELSAELSQDADRPGRPILTVESQL